MVKEDKEGHDVLFKKMFNIARRYKHLNIYRLKDSPSQHTKPNWQNGMEK